MVLLSTDNAACAVTGHAARDSKSGLIPIIDLLEIVVQHWDVYENHRHTDLLAMFHKFDTVRRHPCVQAWLPSRVPALVSVLSSHCVI